MKNIIRIARNDIHNIRKNVIALIVIFGITIVPSLYAWFNIAASWDPYKNTGNLKVAVASLDKGYDGELLPVRLNLGNDIISSLRENTQLHWIFTDAKDASNGVRSGKYYASVVISETFSKDMMSLFSSETTHPTITYCINEKENAIAPKVTEKGADAIRQEINETFTETISKTALDAFRFVADVSAEKGDASLAENLSASLAEISADLDSASGTVQAFSDMTDAASLMLDTTSVIFSHTGDGTKTSLGALTDAGNGIASLSSALSGTTDAVSQALSDGETYYSSVSSTIQTALDAYSTDADAAFTSLNAVSNRIQTVIDGYTSLADSLTAIKNANPNLSLVIDPILKQISTAVEHQTNLKAELDNAGIKITGAVQNADSLKTEIDGLIKESLTSTSEVKDSYEATVKNQLENLAGSLGSTGSSVSALLTQLNEGASDLTDITNSASDDLALIHGSSVSALLTQLNEGASDLTDITNSASDDLALIHTSLSDSSTLLSNVSEQLSSASEALLNPNRDGLSVLTDLLAQKPEAIAAFLASPVSLSEHPVYPIENYGSAMAPFYSTLAMWVGGVVLAAMLKVNVSGKALTGVFNPKPHETYIGRSLLFIAIGLLQSSLICLGDLFYLNIQCQHPVYFLFAGWFTSIVYVSIIYALTVSFGDIGKAVCVVLLVMQVAGSGGTFPIEVAPDFFQKVYPLLPFTHSMNAMRECIAGFYSTVYWKELGTLALFLIPALLLGLLLRKPVIRLNDAFTEKLESTKLI